MKKGNKATRHQGIKSGRDTDRVVIEGLLAWFERNARTLPWRDAPAGERDPYRVLVSEAMLQQTQVSRVIHKFELFIARFPTISDLASAEESEVLALWSGLGYYRRARLLHAAARAVVQECGGVVPREAAALRALPGVGRYTAGAVASIAFGEKEAAVDGNVTRVLLRIAGRDGAADEKETVDWAWKRANGLVAAAKKPGAVNEALMELGATVCTPVSPRCGTCPHREICVAALEGLQERIPRPKKAATRKTLWCDCVVVTDAAGRLLMEQRGAKGLWASMWQVPTVESDVPLNGEAPARWRALLGTGGAARIGEFTHTTTHRDIRFTVWSAAGRAKAKRGRWVALADLGQLGVSNAQKRVIGLGTATLRVVRNPANPHHAERGGTQKAQHPRSNRPK